MLSRIYANSFDYRDFLRKGIWDALTKINYFFRDICSNKLYNQNMEELETNIVQTIYNLEMIFSQSFFNSIKHLLIHLPFKKKVGGHV